MKFNKYNYMNINHYFIFKHQYVPSYRGQIKFIIFFNQINN